MGNLDRKIGDDRLIAQMLQIQYEHPASAVVLVSSDVNFQTKSLKAGISFIEPPEDFYENQAHDRPTNLAAAP